MFKKGTKIRGGVLFCGKKSFSPLYSFSMSDVNAPLLAKRRLEDESSNHNLTNGHDEEEEEPTDYGGVYRYPPYLQPGHFTSLEKLMFFSSSILLILLFILAGLYARSSQQDNHLPSLPTLVPSLPKNHTKKQVNRIYI